MKFKQSSFYEYKINIGSVATVCMVLIALCLGACQKNIDEFEPYRGITLKKRLLFVVEDDYAQGISDVEIELDGQVYNTDENGNSYIHELGIERGTHRISLMKEGFFPHLIGIDFLHQDKSKVIRVKMKPLQLTESFSAEEDQVIEYNDIRLEIPGGIFQDEEEVKYTGTYSVAINRIPTQGHATYKSYQGYSGGRRVNNAEVAYENFGQFQLQFYDDFSQPLQIAPNSEISVIYRIGTDLESYLFSASPLWKLNEETAIWEEYAFTEYRDRFFDFKLSQAGTFMVGAAFPPARVSGRIVSYTGKNLSDEYIDILNIDGTVHSVGLDPDGAFTVILPQNEDLNLELKNACGEVVGQKNLGVFQVPTDLHEISFRYAPEVSMRLTTTDCMNNPIDGGYFIIRGYGRDITVLSESSEVNILWPSCISPTFPDQTISYVNIGGLKSTILYDESIVADVGSMHSCKSIFKDEWLIIQGDKRHTINQFAIEKSDAYVTAFANLPEGAMEIQLNRAKNEVKVLQSPYDNGDILESFFIMEEYGTSELMLSYKIRYVDMKETVQYGRIKTSI